MAKVTLRLYNREIEGLIDQGGTSEAMAHCRHILKTFPKHLETYRMLGKSYLESRRYNEAVDVFSRVLMSVPNDFVSHVGMSIIRDEENKLDDAIWHMERAFESQPSNPAIQGELQRLYGRRDGMEPPKVRMTRGALANMYVQGELYPQAIAEIRAVLSQDPQRADMQVLLARAYYKSGQKADASDICRQLLDRYPYCFDANRIMLDLLPPKTGKPDTSELYRARVSELDPYAAFVKGSVFQSNEVADAAVSLERLEYTGEEVAMGQDWGSSLGIGLVSSSVPALANTASADQPDWLKDFSPVQSEVFVPDQDAPTLVSKPKDEIPDFMRAAGWGESSGGSEVPASPFDLTEAAGGDVLAPADVPDWLRGQAPTDSVQPFGTIQAGSDISLTTETPDWLAGLGGPAPAQPLESAPVPSSQESPDWLSGLGKAEFTESAPAQPGETPDWLSGLGKTEFAESTPAQPSETPEWLSGFGSEQPLESSGSMETAETAQEARLPDWVGESVGQAAQPEGGSVEGLGASVQEQDDAMAWLESLAAKHGAKPEELVTDPNKRTETPPDWVEQARAASRFQASAPPEASMDRLGASAQEQDDAVAWLESLAAKHGARPEELVTDPKKRSETPPDWVEQARAVSQPQPAAQPSASIEDLGSSAQEQDDAVAWLESLAAKHGAKPEELVTDPGRRSETPPDWVQQARSSIESQPAEAGLPSGDSAPWSENAQNIGEQFFAEFEDTSTAAQPPLDETGMWLKRQAEKEKLDKAASPASSFPDWISDEEKPVTAIDADAAEKSDLPEWLSGTSDKPVEQEFVPHVQHMSRGDLSDWLIGLDEEPGAAPEPASTDRDLPDWLSSADSGDETSKPDWMKTIELQAAPTPASGLTEEPAPVSKEADLPGWLQGVDDKSEGFTGEDEGEVPWLRKDTAQAEGEPQLKPTSPSDWRPVERKEAAATRFADLSSRPPMPKPKRPAPQSQEPVYGPIEDEFSNQPPAESYGSASSMPPIRQPAQPIIQPVGPSVVKPIPQPVVPPAAQIQSPAQAQSPLQKSAAVKKGGARPGESQPGSSALTQAKDELERGDIPAALEHYGKLIKRGKHLEETIRDLSDSIYRYPVEVGIWQTLGDAYMRANRLKEALDAYNKAEELIR